MILKVILATGNILIAHIVGNTVEHIGIPVIILWR